MNKQMIKLWAFMLGMMATSNVFALNQLNCDQLLNTTWINTTNYQFGTISLTFDWVDEDPFSVQYDLSYYGNSMGYGSQTPNCNIEPDGSMQLILNLEDHGYLGLKTNNMITFEILPGSYLLTDHEKFNSISGTFLRS